MPFQVVMGLKWLEDHCNPCSNARTPNNGKANIIILLVSVLNLNTG
jgi:hypothetical protein